MRRSKPLLNHYPKWKYLVLGVTLLVMLLSALPTMYGEHATVQIENNDQPTSVLALQSHLQANGINTLRIDQAGTHTEVVLADASQQTAAREQLADLTGANGQVTMAMTPAAPAWLLGMGFTPIKLGLDLRGGVQFLLDIDMQPVYQAQSEKLVDELRQYMRDNEIRGARIQLLNDERVGIMLPASASEREIVRHLRDQYPGWQIIHSSDRSVTAMLSEQEQTEQRNLTVQQVLTTLRDRIQELGISEAVVQRQGAERVRIELPGVQDPAVAKRVIGATSSLAFYAVQAPHEHGGQRIDDANGQSIPLARHPVLTGEHIIDARASRDEFGMAEVNITLDRAGGAKMREFSRANIGKPMATVYNEYMRDEFDQTQQHAEVISIATIQSQLADRFRITGAGSFQESQQLALLLRAGSLTAPVTIVEERTIGPSLGAENIQNGFAALGLGLGATLLFMALWYRRMGWVANVALLSNLVLLLGLLALIPGTVLTLPGIAGLVLTVGIAVDTNVLIFERIREKLRQGHSLAMAIDQGFSGSLRTILDANITSLITALILYSIGNGPIQGFAITMGLGLLTSMFSGLLISRGLINLVWGRDKRREVRV
ncbi:protein translocase subunit SecD [Corallincola luteus]|uniref:Protein translocase subunit SecD n=1 Tax=Corallincola luteus TaxID=1775177 RepID=A0ABY2AKT4_9GAMM|nr:protein translocase subunit SecD [Corallincola luteus]TCI02432.1 protein translocase subunit SecD [Corallincola luteus]